MSTYTVNSVILAKLLNKLFPKIYITTDKPHELIDKVAINAR